MNEKTDPKTLQQCQEDGQMPSEKRRKLLKLGVSASPIVLTLSSRSVLACHCRSPSAAGSVTFASHAPTTDGRWDDPLGYDINGYVKDFSGWMTYANYHSGSLPGGITKYTRLGDVKIDGAYPFSGNPTKIKDLPAGFERDIVTAYMNLNSSAVAQSNCLSFRQLRAMASGTYQDPANGILFGKVQISQYLRDNWLLG